MIFHDFGEEQELIGCNSVECSECSQGDIITLFAEWVDYMSAYRLYDPRFPQWSVAYVDTIEEAFRPGYEIVEV